MLGLCCVQKTKPTGMNTSKTFHGCTLHHLSSSTTYDPSKTLIQVLDDTIGGGLATCPQCLSSYPYTVLIILKSVTPHIRGELKFHPSGVTTKNKKQSLFPLVMGEAIDLPLCLTTYQFNPYQLLLVVVTRSERLKSKPYWEGFAYIRNGFGKERSFDLSFSWLPSFFYLLSSFFVVVFVLINKGNPELSVTFRHGDGYVSPW